VSSFTKTFEPDDADEDDSFPLAPFAALDAGSATSVNSASKPVATIPQLASWLTNGFWQYNNTIAHHWASSTITFNIDGLNANEQMLALSALNAWHEVANLTFVQTSGAANITFTHNGTMTAYETDNFTGSGAITSATINISADWITNDGGAYDGRTGIDSYGYQTYIHEVGHALGLGHQGPYNGSATYSANAIYADDTWQYSVMSYFPQNNYSGSSYRYVITPQMADIYAAVSIYGAAVTRTGDTVYGFHNTAGSIFNFASYSQAPALTIYDSGGNDTLNCSGYSSAQTIDLHAGSFSSVGGLVNNIGIALNANIENAIGGSGNDRLTANDLGDSLTGGSGNDTLIGGAGTDQLIGSSGVDTMTGGGGADTFAFALGDSSPASGQHDRITDFAAGLDHIDLSGIDAVSSTGAYDPFHFLGAAAFDGSAGALAYAYNSSTGVTTLQGDTNGDGVADFAIDLTGNVAISVGDLVGAAVANSNVIGGLASIADLNADGHDDILWRNDNGTVSIWDSGQIGGAHWISNPGVVPSTSHISGAADFDGNGEGDILWRDDNGAVFVWDNGDPASAHTLSAAGVVPASWHIVATGDFNGNNRDDILWQNDNGTVSIWDDGQLAGAHVISNPGAVPASSHIAGVGDFDGNGRDDILWRDDNGAVFVWDDGQPGNAHTAAAAGVIPGGWQIAGIGDFDGNGRDDILWRNDNGTVSIWDNGQIGGAHWIANPGVVPSGWHIA
jgi:Ca2+-binding RTX toxin-like protein